MKVVIGGSFSVYEEMKELKRKLEEVGIECILPKHSKGYENANLMRQYKQSIINGNVKLSEEDYKNIGKVESWFFEQIKTSDCVIIHNKTIKGNEEIEGYIGINASTDIGYAIASGKEVILTYSPIDVGIRGLCSTGLLKVMSMDEIVKYLKGKGEKVNTRVVHLDISSGTPSGT